MDNESESQWLRAKDSHPISLIWNLTIATIDLPTPLGTPILLQALKRLKGRAPVRRRQETDFHALADDKPSYTI